jgi:hypothetical protein
MSNIETLKNRFLQGRLTRREFLAQVSALGLAAAHTPDALTTVHIVSTCEIPVEVREPSNTIKLFD